MQRQSGKDVKDAAILLQASPVGSNRSSIVSSNSSHSSGYSSASSNGLKAGFAMHPSESSSPASLHQHPPPTQNNPYNITSCHSNQELNNRSVVASNHVTNSYRPQQFVGRREDEQLTLRKQEVFEWLQSINMAETFHLFIKSGYDIVTISRMTPEDLTAIGITNPELRKRISNEISKMQIQDPFPSNWPGSLFYWLEMLHLLEYFDLLSSEGCSTLDRLLEVTWEDFEEMKIHKLGHLKKLVLAIDRLKRSSCGADPSKMASRTDPFSATPGRLPYSSIDNYLQLRGVHTNNKDQINQGSNGTSHAIEYVPIHLNRSWSGMLTPQQEDARPSSLLVRYESFHGDPYNDFKSLVADQDANLDFIGGDMDCCPNDVTPTNHSMSPLYFRESRSSIVPSPAPLTPLTPGLPPLPPISPQPSPTKNFENKPRPPPKPKPKPSLQIGLGGRTGQDNFHNHAAVLPSHGELTSAISARSTGANKGPISLSPPPPKRDNLVGELGVVFRRRNNSGEYDCGGGDRISMRSQNTPPPPPKRTNSVRENLNVVVNDGSESAVKYTDASSSFTQNNDEFNRNSSSRANSVAAQNYDAFSLNCHSHNSFNSSSILQPLNGAIAAKCYSRGLTSNGQSNFPSDASTMLPASRQNLSDAVANKRDCKFETERQASTNDTPTANVLYNSANNHKLIQLHPLPTPLTKNDSNHQRVTDRCDQLLNNGNMYVGRGDLELTVGCEDLPYPPPPAELNTLPFANENMGTMKQKGINDCPVSKSFASPTVFKTISKPIVAAKPNLKQTISCDRSCDVSSVFEDIDSMFAGLTEELNNLIAMQK